MTRTGDVDVVLPVHDNRGDLQRLLDNLRTAATRRRIIVRIVDDASREDIASLVPSDDARCRFVYSRNARNLGFAASVNVALGASRNDVVLLNSDTLVFGDWVDRLVEAAQVHPRTATATPLSNAATILSYPVPLIDNPDLLDVTWMTVDRICASGPCEPIDVPTGIGFCMLITRACLDEIGTLDVTTFGKGYGEECDFCRRAAARGWRNVAAPNVFVWHRGGGSFLGRRAALNAEAQARLLERYPDYGRLVAAFITADPIRPIRTRIDAGRVARAPAPRRLIVAERSAARNASASDHFLQRCPTWWRREWRLVGAHATALPNLPALRSGSRLLIEGLLRACSFDEIVVPRASRIPRSMRRAVTAAAHRAGVPVTAEGRT